MPRALSRENYSQLYYNNAANIAVAHNSSLVITSASGFTLSGYVRLTSDDTSDSMGIISKLSGGYLFRVNKVTRKFEFSSTGTVTSTGICEKDKLYHFVCVGNGTTGKIFLNGVLDNSGAQTIVTGSTAVLNIGWQDGSRAWGGFIDQVRIWNRALSNNEAKALYFSESFSRDGLVVEFLNDDGNTTLATDTSGVGNHGTITGCVYNPYALHLKRMNQNDPVALSFVNATDRVDLPSIPAIDINTFSYWARIKTTALGTLQTIEGPTDGVTATPLWRVNATGFLELVKTGVGIMATSTRALLPNTYYDVGVTYDGATASFYVDAVKGGNTAVVQTFSFNPRQLGTYGTGTDSFKGSICEFGVANTILTQTDFLRLKNGVTPASKVCYFGFNEGAGTSVTCQLTGAVGTVTGAGWVADPANQRRKILGNNLVKNGDISYRPSSSTPSVNVSDVFVNGTASGDANASHFGWKIVQTSAEVGTAYGAYYSNAQGLDWISVYSNGRIGRTGGTISAISVSNTNQPGGSLPESERKYLIPVKPNTKYKFSCDYMVNSADTGITAAFNAVTYTGALVRVNAGIGGIMSDMTIGKINSFAFTFTTSSTDRYVNIRGLISTQTDGLHNLSADVSFRNMKFNENSQLTQTNVRNIVGGNLAPNGLLSYIPSPNVATTTGARWPDGTVGGSTVLREFGWYFLPPATNASFLWDTTTTFLGRPSIKLSNTNTTGRSRAWTCQNGATSPVLGGERPYLIPLKPNTQYTLSMYIKTNNVAGSGCWASIYMYKGDFTSATMSGNSTNAITGTTDFALSTVTFTTDPDCYWAEIILRNDIAGNISDAWFNSITLARTTPEARVTL